MSHPTGRKLTLRRLHDLRGSLTLTPPPHTYIHTLQISLLLGPWKALRSGVPDGSVRHPQRLSLPRVLRSVCWRVSCSSVPLCASFLGPGSWWPGPGGRNKEGSGPAHRSPWLCARVSTTPGCVLLCTEQRCSASLCQGFGAAVPTLYASLHWHLQF